MARRRIEIRTNRLGIVESELFLLLCLFDGNFRVMLMLEMFGSPLTPILPFTLSHISIWEKIWRAWVYVVTGKGGSQVGGGYSSIADVQTAEWFVKVDADTYLFPENLRRYVEYKKWSYEDHHYFGHVLNHRRSDRKVSIVAGAAVFFSRATLFAAAGAFGKMSMEKGDQEEDGTCRDAYTGTEEVVTAVCLKQFANVTADPALDANGREQISLYNVEDILTYNRTDMGEWWFWEGKTRYPCHDDGDCIAHLPLAFHGYKQPSLFLAFEKEFYGSVMKGEDDPSHYTQHAGIVAARKWDRFDVTYEYFERVRSAMRAADAAESGQPLVSSDVEKQSLEKEATNMAPQEVSIATSNNNRVYCMVPFIWTPAYLPSYHALRRTWGKRCDVLKFFIDPIIGDASTGYIDLRVNSTNANLPGDVVVIHDMRRPWNACVTESEENCRNIWEKLWRSWIWVDSNGDSDTAEWFVKVDADTYLFPEHLKRYVKQNKLAPTDHHYFGHVLRHHPVPLVAGTAVVFSRATLKAAVKIYRTFDDNSETSNRCHDELTDQEEVITSICLKQHLGVDAHVTLDDQGQELISLGEIEDTLLWNRTEQGEWWYWENKPKLHPDTEKEMHQCCGVYPIAFHGYKDAQWLYKLEDELYGMEDIPDDENRWKNYEWRNAEVTHKYFDRVRAAMKVDS